LSVALVPPVDGAVESRCAVSLGDVPLAVVGGASFEATGGVGDGVAVVGAGVLAPPQATRAVVIIETTRVRVRFILLTVPS